MNIEKHFRKLSELSLIDNFLFGLFVQEATDEEIKGLLEIMLDMKIVGITIKEKQHSIYNDTDEHGVVLDAFIRDDRENIYNVEVQAYYLKCLPKRMRFQQALIDREQIPRGSFDYDKLPKTIIIYVTNYDPFGKGLYRYTFRNTCIEDNTVEYSDDSLKVVLNAVGKVKKGVSEELVELLHYFMRSDEETAAASGSKFVKSLEKKIKPIKNSKKFGDDFMSYQETIFWADRKGEERGLKKGEEIGLKKGEEIGLKKGEEIGLKKGEERGLKKGEERGEKIGLKKGDIKGTVETYFELDKTFEETIAAVIRKFTLTREEAVEYVNKYRPAEN